MDIRPRNILRWLNREAILKIELLAQFDEVLHEFTKNHKQGKHETVQIPYPVSKKNGVKKLIEVVFIM